MVAAGLIFTTPVALAQTQNSISGNINIVRWAKGTVEYRSLSTGEVSGTENWHLTVHPDGSRAMQARNRLDLAGFQRHVTYRVAENFRPLDVTSVYWVNGEWRGTGLLAIDGNRLDATINTPDGLIRQERTVPDHFSMIPHPPVHQCLAKLVLRQGQGRSANHDGV